VTADSLTIVVPLFNGRPFLGQLLASLKAQEAAVDRYLFIDDRGADGSLDCVRAFGLRRADYVANDVNLGLYATLNRALTMVETDLAALVFQDDLLLAGYADAMRALSRRRPEANFFTCGSARLDAAGAPIHMPCGAGGEWTQAPGAASWRDVLLHGTSWIISGSMSRTAALRAYGFRPDLPQCGDFEFFVRAARGETFVYFDRPLAAIREHPAQASAGNLARSIDLTERISILGEQRRRWPDDFDAALRLRLFRRYGYDIAARALGQLRRGRWRMGVHTSAHLARLADALWLGASDRGGRPES
jgi:glycosyltransferase involved in cell wall biosynthesis